MYLRLAVGLMRAISLGAGETYVLRVDLKFKGNIRIPIGSFDRPAVLDLTLHDYGEVVLLYSFGIERNEIYCNTRKVEAEISREIACVDPRD